MAVSYRVSASSCANFLRVSLVQVVLLFRYDIILIDLIIITLVKFLRTN